MTAEETGTRGVAAIPAGQWPEIPLLADEEIVGRSKSCSRVLDHSSISRRHARLSRQDHSWALEDLQSRLGTFVNGTRIARVSLNAGDVVRFGRGPQYRFDGECLKPDSNSGPMAISLRGVEVRAGPFRASGIDLNIPAGGFVGLLGASGSGKSLLLECLSGQNEPSQGSILADGDQPIHAYAMNNPSDVGFVTQEDLVYRYLTVRESLQYAARMRSPDADAAALKLAAEDALRKVELEPHADKRVAQLSGGQQKRVSIAVELLSRPRLLLLDEPTSGLDPGTQARLMGILRGLSRQGITVACSTHTTETMHYFDTVTLLGPQGSGKTVVYSGPPDGLLTHFAARNMADLFDALRQAPLAAAATPPPGTAETPAEVSTAGQGALPRGTVLHRPLGSQEFAGQTRACLWRNWLGFWRDGFGTASGSRPPHPLRAFWRSRTTFCLAAIQPLALALLVVLTQCSQSRSTSVHFFLVISILWLGMTLTVREVVLEKRLYTRDRLAGMHPGAYLTAKLAFAAIVLFFQAAFLLGAERFLVVYALPQSGEILVDSLTRDTPLVAALLALWLVGFGGAVIGLLVSTLSSSERAAIAILPLLLLPQALVSRVGYGQGGNSWMDRPTPFGPIAELSADCRKLNLQETCLLAASMIMISRPGTAAIDLLQYGGPAKSARHAVSGLDLVGEWIYLILLLLLHVLVLVVVFCRAQGRWKLSPR